MMSVKAAVTRQNEVEPSLVHRGIRIPAETTPRVDNGDDDGYGRQRRDATRVLDTTL